MNKYSRCPSYRNYNVFGIKDKGCCYCYMTYCKDIDSCTIKEIVNKCECNDFVKSKEILNIIGDDKHDK